MKSENSIRESISLKIKVRANGRLSRSLAVSIIPELKREKRLKLITLDNGLELHGNELSLVECRRTVRAYLTLLKTAYESIREASGIDERS